MACTLLTDGRCTPCVLVRYNSNRVLRAAAVQGMSRLSSAILFQYNHPLDVEWGDGTQPPFECTALPQQTCTAAERRPLEWRALPQQTRAAAERRV
jgi:hypothetical protein